VLDNMVGAVESFVPPAGLDRGTISGWAVDRRTPGVPAYIDFWIDGEYAGGTLASTYRPDIAASLGVGTAGFQFTIPDRWWDGAYHRVDVYEVAPSAESWNHILLNSNGPSVFRLDHTPDPMAGMVESVDVQPWFYPNYMITGWAIDQATPNTPVYVDFWVDGQYWGGTQATGYRADVEAAYGVSQSGYQFTIPPQFIDGGCHHADVYAIAPTAETWNHIWLMPLVSTDFCFP
jgi:hypothetical protein